MDLRRHVSRVLLVCGGLAVLAGAHAQEMDCGDPFAKTSNGPYDYRTTTADKRAMVEGRHFTEDVRMMRKGSSTKNLAGDIAYTLNVYPNHPQALMTMAEWSMRSGRNPPEGTRYTVECWFERGVRFRPDDPMVRMAYGIYLFRKARHQAAVTQFEAALKNGGDSPNLRYNLGLAYFEVGDFDKALASAHSAYRGGFSLPGLRDKLKRAGRWSEPEQQTATN
ncbi:tetratricopeptide repeat protein [Pseudothauera rhizosphaerae]|uniref:Tetratricopeptide repeat protein n=1 Tax=Pseudothauera rhizosphaerae TaxID=2565932 RepID=A0A4S4API4_9RHOO|nr:tetratricopeptide repeat protein [Pseudothauera rhizosphaerae]THF61604.1 tetratricopeptide repeat protein [Pseudothauera rhizosphaerae]